MHIKCMNSDSPFMLMLNKNFSIKLKNYLLQGYQFKALDFQKWHFSAAACRMKVGVCWPLGVLLALGYSSDMIVNHKILIHLNAEDYSHLYMH